MRQLQLVVAILSLTFLLLPNSFADERCSFDTNFYTYCFVVVGFFFSSCLLIFGLRTYPWCLRKRRSPTNCRVVEAKELTEEEILNESQRWSSGRTQRPKSLESEEETIEFYDESIKPETMESYQELKDKLDEINRKLLQSEQDYRKAIARAKTAESLLETYSRARSNASNSTSNNDDGNQKTPIVVFEDNDEDEEDATKPLEEEDDSIVQLSLASQLSLISERAERLSVMRVTGANKEEYSSGEESLDDEKIEDMFQDLEGGNKKDVAVFTEEFKTDR